MRVFFVIIIALLTSCYVGKETKPDQQTWQYALPSEEGLNNSALLSLDQNIQDDSYKLGTVNGLIIIRNNKLVFENYYNYNNRESLKPIGIATFAVNTLTLSQLMSDGYIHSLDTPIYHYLPEYKEIFDASSYKKQITINHLLNYTSGLSWNQVLYNPDEPQSAFQLMKASEDWTKYVLSEPIDAIPGTRRVIHTGTGILLSKIFQNVLGEVNLKDYIDKNLFKPMNITTYQWETDPTGTLNGSTGLYLMPLDYVKIGYLLLLDGRWVHQERIIDRDWVYTITNPEGSKDQDFNYGYGLWKINENLLTNVFSSINSLLLLPDNGGNNIYVIPDENMVVGIMAQNYNFGPVYSPSLLMLSRVTSAIQTSEAGN